MVWQISRQHLVIEIAEDTFASTTWATALATNPAFSNLYREFYANVIIQCSEVCHLLKQREFKSPMM